MKTTPFKTIAVVVWLMATLAGTWLMLVYANAPGDAGMAAELWPEPGGVPQPPGRPKIVLFVHPHCPCSRATLAELAQLMAHEGSQADARVVFLSPEGMGDDWVKTDLWTAAAAIPGVSVERDAGGCKASTFGAVTSGDTLLYDGTGRLLFHGGITVSRGHAGDNPGRSAIEALLRGESIQVATPVFGCALFEKSKEDQTCKQ